MTVATSARVRVREVAAFQRPVPLRMPFKLGTTTFESLEVVHVRVIAESEGRLIEGTGASVLSPLWFDKAPDRDFDSKRADLVRSIAIAAAGYREAGTATPWELHGAVQPAVLTAFVESGLPALTSSYGVALIDGAIIDALCRSRDVTFHDALRADLFGFGDVPGLPRRPTDRLAVRHTIGMGDPLTPGDLGTPLDDGLPETLEEVVHGYGVRFFKIKIGSDIDANLARLHAIQQVLGRTAARDYRVVLDGNEAFPDHATFVPFVERLATQPALMDLYDRLLWIEQPVARSATLADGIGADIRRAGSFRPLILDESDATDDTVEVALRCGYSGVSAKNCKGVFRTLHAVRVLADHPGSILSAEDLTHPSLAPLHQDTAVITALGLPHAERNGHHYVRGLSFLPEADQRVALADYPSLYEVGDDGLVRLRIRDGDIDVSELVSAPYGLVSPPDVSSMDPLPLDQHGS